MFSTIMDIPGQTSEKTLECFKAIASTLKEKSNCLEIGSAWGRSASMWLEVLPEGSKLDIVDSFTYNDPQWVNDFKNHTFGKQILENIGGTYDQEKIFMHNVRLHKNFSVINNVYKMISKDFINKVNKKNYDLVFLDGDHSYECVTAELKYFHKVPVICGDDFSPNHPEVMSAVTDFYFKKIKSNSRIQLYGDTTKRFWCIWNADHYSIKF